MRCNNCGWDNPDGSQRCEKCNAPLQGGVSSPIGGHSADYCTDYLHSTIREAAPFESPQHSKTTIDETIIDEPQVNIYVTPPQSQPSPKAAPTEDFTGTVNPYAGMGAYMPIHHCILKPVIFPGEDMRDAPKPVNIKGDYTELNRQLIDPDNKTITSKVQATLTFKDGKWYIQNQSAQKTTYVSAEEPVSLKTGDIILMGNRTFVFEED